GVKRKQALPPFFFLSCLPGDRQRLNPAIREFDEILLQRIDAEGVFHLEFDKSAVRPVGFDAKLPRLSKETRMHAVIVETRTVEVAEHRLVARVLHRGLVLRGAPQFCFRLVTPRARLAADEARRCRSFTSIPQPKTDPTDNDDK